MGAGAGALLPIVPPAVLRATVGAGAGAEDWAGPADGALGAPGAPAVGAAGALGGAGAEGAATGGLEAGGATGGLEAAGATGAVGVDGAAGVGTSSAFKVTRTVSFLNGTAEVFVIGFGGFGASSLIV